MGRQSAGRAPRKHVYAGDQLSDPPPPELAAILAPHRGRPDALMTALEEVQRHYGYLPQRQLRYLARELGYPLSRVWGVATFYNLFQFTPPGRYVVRVCRGTACHVNGADAILAHLERGLGVGAEETTPDGLFTLQTVACTGACSLAPVVVVNDHAHGRMTPETAWAALAGLRAEASGEGAAR
jgi:NADH:ubiquinone oxidoreductase subunit E